MRFGRSVRFRLRETAKKLSGGAVGRAAGDRTRRRAGSEGLEGRHNTSLASRVFTEVPQIQVRCIVP